MGMMGLNQLQAKSEQTKGLREAFTGVQGAGPLPLVGAASPYLKKIVFCKLNMHKFRPFLLIV